MPELAKAVGGTDSAYDAAAAGKRFVILVVGVLMIFVAAENFRKIKTMPSSLRKVTEDKKMVAAWSTFLTLLYAGFIYQPEAEDPSVLMSFGAGIQLFAMLLLYAMPRKAAVAGAGPSGDAPEFALLMAVALICRLSCTTRFLGYLPTDTTGDGCYQVLEGLSVALALRGLSSTGITPKQGIHCVVAVGIGALCSCICYGDLNRRVVWDRIYAAGTYIEFFSWWFLAAALLKTRGDRSLKLAFLCPACAQAAVRAIFWFLAIDELNSFSLESSQIRLMAYFGHALLAMHTITTVGLAAVGLRLVCCKAGSALPLSVPVNEAGPFLDFVQQMMTTSPSAPPGMAAVRAVFEDGKFKVEYEPIAEPWHALA